MNIVKWWASGQKWHLNVLQKLKNVFCCAWICTTRTANCMLKCWNAHCTHIIFCAASSFCWRLCAFDCILRQLTNWNECLWKWFVCQIVLQCYNSKMSTKWYKWVWKPELTHINDHLHIFTIIIHSMLNHPSSRSNVIKLIKNFHQSHLKIDWTSMQLHKIYLLHVVSVCILFFCIEYNQINCHHLH